MLTGKLVRVRHARDRIIPHYLDPSDPQWLEAAEQLLTIYRSASGATRGQIEDEVENTFGEAATTLVQQGLAKLLEDRCAFETIAGLPPQQIREVVFRTAATRRGEQVKAALSGEAVVLAPAAFRPGVLAEVAAELQLTPEAVEAGLFADLRREQRLVRFRDITPERLLQRYNVALAQAILLRATSLQVIIRNEPPQRYRQLLRLVKFHRLVCEVEALGEKSCLLKLDGPLSLFTATQKYGLQLALFLPAVLLCQDFDLTAEIHWGAQRKPKKFHLSPRDKLVSHHVDSGMYVPPELTLFVELFRKKIEDWDIRTETEVLPLGESFWVPDYRLIHRASGEVVYLDVLGFWRKSSFERHLQRLRQHAPARFVLALSEQLRIDDSELAGLPAGIHRFRNMPLPEEVVKLAEAARAGNCL